MPKATTLQGDFSAGELSPLLYGRTSVPRYKQGLDTCTNYLPTLQGPLVRRPGTKYLTNVKDSSTPPALIPFNFSETQAYVLEFGNNYVRFYTNGGQVVTSGTLYSAVGAYGAGNSPVSFLFPFYSTRNSKSLNYGESVLSYTSITAGSVLELQSPYAYTDVADIKWAQSNDVLYLFHPKYPVYKLSRYGALEWDMRQVAFQDGPYLALNTYENFGDSTQTQFVSVDTNMPVTTLVSAPQFSISGAITDPAGSGQIQITTSAAHSYYSGQNVFIWGVGGTTEANNNDNLASWPGHSTYWSINVTSTTTFLLSGSTFTHAYTSGGTVAPATFQANVQSTAPDYQRNIALIIGGKRYWGFINGIISAQQIQVLIGPLNPAAVAFPGGNAETTGWYLGMYSYANGFPGCGCLHQDRLVMSGCPNSPQSVEGSFTGEYENFQPSDPTTLVVNDDNAFGYDLVSSDTNVLFWLKSTAQGLLAGSYTAEWAITPSSTSDALTPTNVNAQQTSFYGSANVDAVPMGNAVMYVQRAQRKVRELIYVFQIGTFRSSDMTKLSEHITNPSITKIVLQKETQPILWAIRSDGALLSMVYERDDANVQAGWTRHLLGGQSDASGTPPIVQSIAVIPSVDLSFDQVWMTVQRWINGASVITVEYMTKIFDDLALQQDAFQGDCGGTYDNPITITGIDDSSVVVITAPGHGFSNGDRVLFSGIVGCSQTVYDANGNPTTTNLLNGLQFQVSNVTTNTFDVNQINGGQISGAGFSAYVSGGQVRKLVRTISGITWLEGETVGVLTDGGIHPPVVVGSGGAIALEWPAAKVQIGYTFASQGKLLRVEGGAADGTSIGKIRRTSRAAFMLHRVGEISIGTNFKNLIPMRFARADNQLADQAPALYSGIKREGLESAYDFESQICFQQSSMLPGTIQAITSFMDEQDV